MRKKYRVVVDKLVRPFGWFKDGEVREKFLTEDEVRVCLAFGAKVVEVIDKTKNKEVEKEVTDNKEVVKKAPAKKAPAKKAPAKKASVKKEVIDKIENKEVE